MKLFILVLGGLIYVSFQPAPVEANNGTRSRLIALSKEVKKEDDRRKAARSRAARVNRVRKVLQEADSPMLPEAESFITCSERTGVSWKLLLGLAWKESSYGRHTPIYDTPTRNAFGWTGSGVPDERFRTFDSWGDGVCHVAEGLARNYNHKNIRETIMMYAPPSENATESYIAQLNKYLSEI